MTFARLAIFFTSTRSPSPPSRRPRSSPTGRSCRTKPCSTTRRCCASTPAILRATRPSSPSTSSGCSRRKASRRRSSDPIRSGPNLVARLKGNGKKRPLLIMGHSDVVTIDEAKWKIPPFSATRDGGYVYGRGTVDDKDNLTAALMTMLLLKRLNVPLDRDVIFLSEAGEEGSSAIGIGYMVKDQFPLIDAEYCIAEGGGVVASAGR